jgi:parvulin-like peptidyl-prolyl isomerase
MNGLFIRYFLFLSIILSTASPAGFHAAFAQGKKPLKPDQPVAQVNGVPITARMLNLAMEDRLPVTGHRSLSDKRLLEIQREELDKLLVRELIVQEARRQDIQAEKGEIDSEVKKIKGRFGSEKKFRESLRNRGMTEADIRNAVERYIMIRKVSDREVYSKITFKDADLKTYYDGHTDKFKTPEQVRLRIILIAVDPSSLKQDWEAARSKAEGIVERARKGENFADLVAQYSDDKETKSRKGDAGLLHRGRLKYKELEPVAFSTDVGKVGDPIRTLYGYVVFKVEEKKPTRQLKYDEINKELLKAELRKSLSEKRLNEWVGGLRAKAEIKYF